MNTVVSQERADFLWPEGVGAGGHAGEQRILQGILHAKLLKVRRSLGDLATKEELKCNPWCWVILDRLKRNATNLTQSSARKSSCIISPVAPQVILHSLKKTTLIKKDSTEVHYAIFFFF